MHPLSELIHSSFKPALKSFFFFVVLPKACANSRAGIIHMATGMHLGVTPQAVHHPPSYLCVPKEFPEHAAGERDTLPARSLVPLAFSCAFSLSLYVEQHFFFIFFSPKITLLQLFFSFAFSQFLNDTSFLLCTARIYFLFFPSFFFLHSKNRS